MASSCSPRRVLPSASRSAARRSALLERTGDYWEVHIARYQIAASLYYLGDFRGALEETERNYRSGVELGDEQASAIILDVWAGRRARGFRSASCTPNASAAAATPKPRRRC